MKKKLQRIHKKQHVNDEMKKRFKSEKHNVLNVINHRHNNGKIYLCAKGPSEVK